MAASPQLRVAFLIGQQNYADGRFGAAPYTHNDVKAMDRLLRDTCGFQVTIKMDAKRSFFEELPGLLVQSLRGKSESILIFFYAGHGVSLLGEHFVIPIDARAEDPATWINVKDLIRPVHDVAGGAQALRDRIAAEHSTRPAPKSLVLVALDCCLDEPSVAARMAANRMVTAELESAAAAMESAAAAKAVVADGEAEETTFEPWAAAVTAARPSQPTATEAATAAAAKAVVADGEAEETTLEGEKPKPWAAAVTAARLSQPTATEVCIMYACSEGRPAMPCKDAELGHFTNALKRAVEMWPGEDLATISKECRRLCLEASKGRQCPWTADSTSTKWILRPVVHTWGPAAVPQLVELLCGECSEVDRQQAARELRKLAADAVAKAGSTAGSLGLARRSSEAEVSAAARTLRCFAGYVGQLVHLPHEGSSELQVNVAAVLAELAQHGPTGESLRNVGAIPALMRMVQSNEVEVQRQATAALRALAINVGSSGQGTQISTFQAEALLCFLQMLERGQATASEHDALALGNALAASESNRRWITRMGRWPDLVRMLEVRTSGTSITVTSILMEGVLADDSLRPIVQAGAVPYFVRMLGSEHTEMREKAIAVLQRVAEKDDNRNLIEQAGPQLVAILQVEDVDSTSAQEAAACVLTNLAVRSDDNRELILQAGVIPPLVQVLGAGGTVVAKATTALQLLALRDANRVPIAQAGAFPSLAKLLESGGSREQEEAIEAIRRLAEEPANVELIAQSGALLQLVRLLEFGTAVAREQAAFALGDLANHLRVRITQLQAVPSLIRLLQTGSDGAKEAAAYALGGLADGAPENQKLMEQEGACPPLVELLKTGTDRSRQRAAGALGSFVAGNRRNSQLIAQLGAGPYLVHLLESDSDQDKEVATYAFASLQCEEPVCQEEIVEAGACQALVALLETGGDRARLAAFALCNLAMNSQRAQAHIVQLKAVPPLMQMLEREECAAAAAYLLSILAKELRNRELIAQAGACRALAELLCSSRSDAQRTAADALGSLASATIGNNQLITQLVVAPDLMRMLESGTDHVRESAAYAVWALTEWEPGRQEIIAQAGACTALVRVLATGTQHARQRAALALGNIAWSNTSMSKAIAQLGVVGHLLRLVDWDSGATKLVVAKALHQLAEEPQNKKCIVEAGACPALVRLLLYSSPSEAQMWSAYALCKLAMINRRTRELLVELEALPRLIELLQSEHNYTKAAAALTLAYLVNTSTKIQSLLPELGAVPPIVQLVESGSGRARLAAARTLGELAVGHSKNRELIEQAGARPALLTLQETGSAKDQEAAKNALYFLSRSSARWLLFRQILSGAVPGALLSAIFMCAIFDVRLTRRDR